MLSCGYTRAVRFSINQGHQIYPTLVRLHCWAPFLSQRASRREKIVISTFRPAEKWIFLVSPALAFHVKPERLKNNFFINISTFGRPLLQNQRVSHTERSSLEQTPRRLSSWARSDYRGRLQNKRTGLAHAHSLAPTSEYFISLKGLKATLDLLSINHREKNCLCSRKKKFVKKVLNFLSVSLPAGTVVVIRMYLGGLGNSAARNWKAVSRPVRRVWHSGSTWTLPGTAVRG